MLSWFFMPSGCIFELLAGNWGTKNLGQLTVVPSCLQSKNDNDRSKHSPYNKLCDAIRSCASEIGMTTCKWVATCCQGIKPSELIPKGQLPQLDAQVAESRPKFGAFGLHSDDLWMILAGWNMLLSPAVCVAQLELKAGRRVELHVKAHTFCAPEIPWCMIIY